MQENVQSAWRSCSRETPSPACPASASITKGGKLVFSPCSSHESYQTPETTHNASLHIVKCRSWHVAPYGADSSNSSHHVPLLGLMAEHALSDCSALIVFQLYRRVVWGEQIVSGAPGRLKLSFAQVTFYPERKHWPTRRSCAVRSVPGTFSYLGRFCEHFYCGVQNRCWAVAPPTAAGLAAVVSSGSVWLLSAK